MKLGVADQSEVPTVCLFKDHFNEIKSTASQKMIVDGEIEVS